MISRRNFLQFLAYGSLAAIASKIGVVDNYQNVVLILVDSLNDWLSCLGGHPDAQSPNIDRLAKQGILFANAHCAGSNSNASRSSLFTGIAPYESGIYGGEANYRDIYPKILTLPQQFMAARYRSIGAGRLFYQDDKWSWQENPFIPFNNRYVTQSLSGINSGPNFDWGVINVPENNLHDYQVTDWAIGKVQNLDVPFFLGVGLSATRHPWYLPPEQYHRFDPAKVTLPSEQTALLPHAAQMLIRNNHKHELVTAQDAWGDAVAAYLACVNYVDEQVGRLLNALDNSENGKNTIVIFASTHGLHLGDKRYWLFDTLWEQCTRVPLIIRLPEGTSGISQSAVSILDIYPTLLDLFGYHSSQTFDGRSLKPLLSNPLADWDYPVVMSNNERDFAVRSNRWRYIRYNDGGEELYEMVGDRRELINLAGNPAHQLTKDNLLAYLPDNPAPSRA